MADATNAHEKIRCVAKQLNCTYIDLSHIGSNETSDFRRTFPERYIFATGTYAAGLWQPGEDIYLVCLSQDRPKTFWQCYGEAHNIEDFARPMNDTVRIDFAIERSIVGEIAEVILHWCPLPEAFHQSALPSGVLAPSATTASKLNLGHYGRLCDAVAYASRLSDPRWSQLRAVYWCIRAWASSTGIIGRPAAGFTDYESLMAEVSGVYEKRVDAIDSDGHPPKLQQVLTDFREYAESTAGAIRIAAETARLSGRASDHYFDVTPEEGFQAWLDTHEAFVAIVAECYVSSAWKQMASETFPRAVCGFVSELEPLTYHIWPHNVQDTDGSICCTVGLRKDLGGSAEFMVLAETPGQAVITLRPRSREQVQALHHASPASAWIHPSASRGSADSPEKLRTASQAISRLRHDPAHFGIEYEVGYEDRFEGLKWISLHDWGKAATEDEDFIPEHRIRQIRQKGGSYEDEQVVWDRRKKVDQTGSAGKRGA
ncbi:hypothetical protein BAUCODRAFT_144996 [Baudoinia panamericana UAMH 10762]|uniref:MJ1316 RNA cyclic group end recognition domain-containing protein n=1 Tax=Baudoinia panamericana (strain UAMH 10762) TaxID=717646 RepID=M2NJL7_BAUPA|nr:uncharacterized protein BAUCODRAFT_144996 [Baudoinia panamericana UAMH 10762]EMC99599.1 hypothetical protein BAUCODRAFT_144996 [Baudoinia panamericana UAMH 10762]